MKIVFAGTPEFALPSLNALYAAGFDIVAVLTQPDKPQGRKRVLTPSPVKEAAIKLDLPVLQPMKLKEDCSALKELNADCMVTCAYGQILTQEILDLFPTGVWNVHASLLPAYRGAAPIARALMNGETKTGVTIMKTESGLDTGDMLLQESLPIEADDTAGTLSEKLSRLGGELIVKGLRLLESGKYELKKQGEGFVCKKVVRTQADFSRPAGEVSALIRGLSPAPLSFGVIAGLTLNFYAAEQADTNSDAPFGTVLSASPKTGFVVKCGAGAVRILRLQPAGGSVMRDRDFCNGRKVSEGMRFDEPVL